VHQMHATIFEAIKQKDPGAAARAMRDHIGIIRALTEKAMAAAGLTPPTVTL
jgi:DNA-binding GntR family transcriptional regulator